MNAAAARPVGKRMQICTPSQQGSHICIFVVDLQPDEEGPANPDGLRHRAMGPGWELIVRRWPFYYFARYLPEPPIEI